MKKVVSGKKIIGQRKTRNTDPHPKKQPMSFQSLLQLRYASKKSNLLNQGVWWSVEHQSLAKYSPLCAMLIYCPVSIFCLDVKWLKRELQAQRCISLQHLKKRRSSKRRSASGWRICLRRTAIFSRCMLLQRYCLAGWLSIMLACYLD